MSSCMRTVFVILANENVDCEGKGIVWALGGDLGALSCSGMATIRYMPSTMHHSILLTQSQVVILIGFALWSVIKPLGLADEKHSVSFFPIGLWVAWTRNGSYLVVCLWRLPRCTHCCTKAANHLVIKTSLMRSNIWYTFRYHYFGVVSSPPSSWWKILGGPILRWMH